MPEKKRTNSLHRESVLSKQTIDSLHSELDVLLGIFSEKSGEIRNDENKVVENLNYSLGAVGVTIALGNFLATTQQYILLLLLPFVFYILAFLAYSHHLSVFRLGNYLAEIINPRMREIIELLDPAQHDFGSFTMDWETYRRKIDSSFWIRLPISASYFGLHLLFSLVPIFMFFFYKQSNGHLFNYVELAILAINGIVFITLVAYLLSFRHVTRRKNE